MDTWKKYKCVFCGHELASKAKSPRCTKPGCRSTRLDELKEFSAIKQYKEEKKMTEEKAEVPKPKVRHEEEQDDIDEDLWGEDEED